MELGAVIGPVAPSSRPGAVADLARRLEGEGFESLWAVQAVGRGMMVLDPFVALAAAAGATTRVRLGTAVVQLPLYRPAELAHRIFSLQHVAGERLRIGVGAGSTAQDFEVFGRDYASRFAAFDEGLAALRRLLERGEGDGIDLSPGSSVLGGPPLLYGTWGRGVDRAAREFSGWIASAMHRTTEQVVEASRRYRAHGGARAVVSSIVLGPEPEPGAHRRRLDAFAEAGFDEAAVILLPGGPAPSDVRSWVAS